MKSLAFPEPRYECITLSQLTVTAKTSGFACKANAGNAKMFVMRGWLAINHTKIVEKLLEKEKIMIASGPLHAVEQTAQRKVHATRHILARLKYRQPRQYRHHRQVSSPEQTYLVPFKLAATNLAKNCGPPSLCCGVNILPLFVECFPCLQ